MIGVSAISIALRLNSPVVLTPGNAFDDSLFAHQGWMIATDRWLGPYTFATLTKGPGYPLFIAAVYRLHLGLKLSEHLVYLCACGVLAAAAWRMTRSRLLALGLFAALALDPSHFGWESSSLSRDNFYSGVSLLLVGSTLLLVGEVPTALRRGPRWTVPLILVGGVGLGMVAAVYFVTREERIWLGPTLVLAILAAALAWRQDRPRLPVLVGVTVLLFVVAGLTSSWAIGEVRARNEAAYGSRVIGDLAEGEGARAYVEWQRVDVGPIIPWVTINTEQRYAVYEVSPAAAELAPHLEGYGTRWMGEGCSPPLAADCEYGGGHFIWVLREAAWQRGHAGSAADLQEFFGRMADEIAAACDDGRVPCADRGIAATPPLSRVDTGRFWPSLHRLTTYLFSFDGAEPAGASTSTGTPEALAQLQRPLRGLDLTPSEYERMLVDAAHRQWAVGGLADLYRWAARIGVIPALAGVALGLCTRQGRARHGRVALLGLVLLAGAGSRIAALTVVQATAFDTAGGSYLLPATAFLVGFLVTGWWILAHVLLDRTNARSVAQERGAGRENTDPHLTAPDGVAARVPVLAQDSP